MSGEKAINQYAMRLAAGSDENDQSFRRDVDQSERSDADVFIYQD